MSGQEEMEEQIARIKRKIEAWMAEKYPEIVSDGQIMLEQLTVKMFQEFLISLPKTRGKDVQPGYEVKNQYRSALMLMFKERRVPVNPDFKDELSTFYKGLKRIEGEEKSSVILQIDSDKAAMPFGLYVWLAKYF